MPSATGFLAQLCAPKPTEIANENRSTERQAEKLQEHTVSDQDQFDSRKFSDDIRNSAKKFSDELHDQIHRDIHVKINGARKPVVVGIHLGRGCNSAQWGIFTGVLIALVGLVILLDNLNIVAASRLYHFWPLILIAFGLMYFFGRGSRVWGAILMIFGVLLQLDQLGKIHLTWGMLWGLAWIAVGVLVMWGSVVARKIAPFRSNVSDDPSTTLSENVVFGGIERRMTTKDFRGGVVTAIFGGIELDLSEADMQQEQAQLEVNAIFGGVELRVPYNWQVASRGTPIFGGFVDKTRLRNASDSDPKRKILLLTGSAIFGGVDVKN
jgi:predicted membrane protein